jgi:hypothetical protein
MILEPYSRPRAQRSTPKRRPFIRFRMRRRGADDFGYIVLSTEAQRLLALGHRDRVLLLLDRDHTVIAIEPVPAEHASSMDSRQFLVSRWGGKVVISCTPLVRALRARLEERRYGGELSEDGRLVIRLRQGDESAMDGARNGA